MKKYLQIFTILTFGWSLRAEVIPLSSADFLNVLRNKSSKVSTYAKLDGVIEHLRNDKELEEYKLYMGVIITPAHSITQIIVNEKEGYTVGQNGKNTSIVPQPGNPVKSILEYVGLNPADLAMSFVHYDWLEELPEVKLKMTPCRVFVLKNPKKAEFVRITVAKEYYFTLKAEFFTRRPTAESSDAFRCLEVSSFGRKNNLYYAKKLDLYGPGWRTLVIFDEADLGEYDAENPPDAVLKNLK